jgi:hypothetical protein
MHVMLEQSLNERNIYYLTNHIPSINQVDYLINQCADKNELATSGLDLAPGPDGILSASPQIICALQNQLTLIFDIALAYNKHKFLNKEIMLFIISSALTGGVSKIAIVKGNIIEIRKINNLETKFAIHELAENISDKLLLSLDSKWIPIACAIALSIWSRYYSNKVGEKAVECFSKNIIIGDEEGEINETYLSQKPLAKDNHNFEKEKMKCLIKLAKVDEKLAHEELKYLAPIIENSKFTNDEKAQFNQILNDKAEVVSLDYEILNVNKETSIMLIIDLIALANKDKEFHDKEAELIKEIGSSLKLNNNEISELLKNF